MNDKVVKCFTGMIEPTVTDSLFDMYLDNVYGDENTDIDDIDLSQFSDEELSENINSCMLEECQVYLKLRGYWDKELPIIEEEEKMMNNAGIEEGDD